MFKKFIIACALVPCFVTAESELFEKFFEFGEAVAISQLIQETNDPLRKEILKTQLLVQIRTAMLENENWIKIYSGHIGDPQWIDYEDIPTPEEGVKFHQERVKELKKLEESIDR